jgi:hypothetical protein
MGLSNFLSKDSSAVHLQLFCCSTNTGRKPKLSFWSFQQSSYVIHRTLFDPLFLFKIYGIENRHSLLCLVIIEVILLIDKKKEKKGKRFFRPG